MSEKCCTYAPISTEFGPKILNGLHQQTVLLGENKIIQPRRIVAEPVTNFER